MARDKLITIRIEGEKRDAFNQLAKSQNSDTASLLYDFISQCLSGTIDISLVMGKGQRIDKLDNQLDTNRLDKLETDTQRLDNWIGALSERLNDWILRSDQRLTDSDQGLSEKIISLEHRLNALAMQLDSQQDSQQIDSIDTDSQQIDSIDTDSQQIDSIDTDSQQIDSIDTDSQQIDDMEPLLKRERESSIASPIPTDETVRQAIETLPTVETVEPISSIEPVTDAIETAIKVKPRRGYSNSELSEKLNISKSTIEKWKARIQRGEKFEPKVYPNFFDHWLLDTDNLWYPEGRLLKKP